MQEPAAIGSSSEQRRPGCMGKFLIGLVFSLCSLAAIYSFMCRQAGHYYSGRHCGRNILVLAKAVQLYALDHQGAPPTKLVDLVPTYLNKPLACPLAGPKAYRILLRPGPHYRIVCQGVHHPLWFEPAEKRRDIPRYDDEVGWTDGDEQSPPFDR